MTVDELVADIRDAAVSSQVDICELLRKTQVLGQRLELVEMSDWAEHELNGYPRDAEVPAYRAISGQAYGDFHDGYGRMITRAPIPAGVLPENLRHWARRAHLRAAISGLTDLLRDSRQGELAIPWPHELALEYGSSAMSECQCLRAWLSVPRTAIVSLIDAVRNRLLKFVLALETDRGRSDSEGDSRSGAATGSVAGTFSTVIYGNVNNLAVNSQHVYQNVAREIHVGDFESLRCALAELGIEDPDLNELKHALDSDSGMNASRDLGPATAGWMENVLKKAAAGAYSIGTSAMGGLLAEMLGKFAGI